MSETGPMVLWFYKVCIHVLYMGNMVLTNLKMINDGSDIKLPVKLAGA